MRIFSLDVTIPIKFLTLFTLLYQMVFISDDSGMLLFEIVIRMKITRRSISRERVFSSHVSLKRKIQSTLEGFNKREITIREDKRHSGFTLITIYYLW